LPVHVNLPGRARFRRKDRAPLLDILPERADLFVPFRLLGQSGPGLRQRKDRGPLPRIREETRNRYAFARVTPILIS
jgi:hypothetical protein